MRPALRLVPRAHFKAPPARRAVGISRSEFAALRRIEVPCLVAVIHLLAATGYGVGMAFHGAFQAFFTKLLQPEVDWLVRLQRQGRSHYRRLKARAPEKGTHHARPA